MKSAYIVDILRTPIGSYGGCLSSVRPDDLAAHVIRAILARNPELDATVIEDVIFGAANQSGEDNRNVARMALLLAGMAESTGGVTVNRLCASGLQAIMDAARALMCGDGESFLAGGVESMSRAPFVVNKAPEAFSRKTEMADTTIGWRFTNPKLAEKYYPYSMGETAENVAAKWKITREQQDLFALGSQEKYAAANNSGKFNDERVPIPTLKQKETVMVDRDEHPRQTSLQKLASLRPAFKENGTVTAGNSSGINDGAAVCLMANDNIVQQFHLTPMARVVSMAVAGVDPSIMGVGPVPAVKKALARANLKIADIGLTELNEAFASQALACIQELSLDPAKTNVNGGSIAIGHPLGCSGVRISATLLHEMARNNVRYGLATMCIGVGQGAAVIYENCRA